MIKINNELKEPVSNVLTGSFCFKGALKDREGLSNLLAFIEANDADGKAAHPCGPYKCYMPKNFDYDNFSPHFEQ